MGHNRGQTTRGKGKPNHANHHKNGAHNSLSSVIATDITIAHRGDGLNCVIVGNDVKFYIRAINVRVYAYPVIGSLVVLKCNHKNP
jgi:hypothetical protein